MKYTINEARCVGCATCSGVCPTQALWVGPNGRQFAIDADKCIGCATCFQVCPFEAVKPVEGEIAPDILPPDKRMPPEFPKMLYGMPHNLDGTSITMEQWLGDEPQFDRIDEVIETDICVVGGGLAGVCAVRAAAEQGANVVLIEKMNGIRGRSGDIAVLGSKLEKEWWGRDNTQYRERIYKEYMRDLGWRTNGRTFKYWLDNNGAAFDWFMDGNPDGYVQPYTGAPVPTDCRTWIAPSCWPVPELWDPAKDYITGYPVTLRLTPSLLATQVGNLRIAQKTGRVKAYYNTPAQKLLRDDDGKMCGVIAQNTKTGKVIQVNARAVVLTTGDFAGNKEMLYYYMPWATRDGLDYMEHPDQSRIINYGDGHRMALRIGAALEDGPLGLINHSFGGLVGVTGFLVLNLRGERFMDEEIDGQKWENALSRQPVDNRAYQLYDSAWPDQITHMAVGLGAFSGIADTPPVYTNPAQGNFHLSRESLEQMAKEGRAIKGDTIEELVSKMDLLDDEAKATALKEIAHYNEIARSGVDSDFFKRADRLYPLEKGPFYAGVVRPANILNTVAGLDCDHNGRVYDTERRIIPGLYVAGNIQGGRFSIEYPLLLPGVSHSFCITFGKRVGELASEYIK